jgi:methylated-DNA-protein-cysteine methyltransferase-like protein
MEELLVREGIEIIDNQIQNFEQIFWDPQKELSIE